VRLSRQVLHSLYELELDSKPQVCGVQEKVGFVDKTQLQPAQDRQEKGQKSTPP
jgi:hypothetical protein